MPETPEVQRLRNELDRLQKAVDNQAKTLHTMGKVLEQLCDAPIAGVVAVAAVLARHGISRNEFLFELDRVATALHPNAGDVGGTLGAYVAAVVQQDQRGEPLILPSSA